MIAQLEGVIAYKGDRYIVLDVHGVGYKLGMTLETLKRLHPEQVTTIRLWTHLVVREDALDLYGFLEQIELEFFELLIGISGVGPKSAIGILSLAPPDVLQKAIMAGDTGYLTKVSGIGRKIAEKIVLELRDKLGALPGLQTGEALDQEADAVEGLNSLGYSLAEAREALKRVPADITDTGERIKAALKQLGK